jgi:DNA-binding response OmpR family regulator
MINNHLTILGSEAFSNILNELEFSNTINDNNKKFLIKIIFAENLKIKQIKNYLLENEPAIIFVTHKDYLKKNNLHLLDFHVCLELPIEIISLKEIINILITKYSFFKKSKIIIKDYEIDCNRRIVTKKKVNIKLTEKELELILALNDNNGLNKSSLLKSIWKHNYVLETHALETHLHRLRKKIYKYFKDECIDVYLGIYTFLRS